MKVILLEEVKKVGKADEIVEVSQGYANNVLFKQNLAVEATKGNLEKLKVKLANDDANYQDDIKEAKKIKTKLESMEFKFKLKEGKGGSVFGSISHKQIHVALTKEGFKIDKRSIHGEPIAHLGYDSVEIQLHKEVVAKIKIKVEGN